MNSATVRRHALSIFQAALKSADPRRSVEQELRRRDFSRFDRILVAGAGKATPAMAQAAERVLGKRIAGGVISTKHGHALPLRRIATREAGHPVPDAAGVAATREILALAATAGPRDLLLCLISGGGSALLPAPAPPVTLEEKQQVTRQLLACGANIHEINAVRKHLSLSKGGRLAEAAGGASVLSLILSDVIGDPLDVIASGPTAPDPSTCADALNVLDRYRLRTKVPKSVRSRLEDPAAETPKPEDPIFRHVGNVIVGSNRTALEAAAVQARNLGYRPLLLSTTIEGETKDVAAMHAAIARECLESGQPCKPPACLISGGETTVTLTGNGLGGRNQEFVVAAALALNRLPGVVVLSGGTDGTDGPTDAAGAVADSTLLGRARAAGLDAKAALAGHNAYPFLDALGALIRTGPTGTNVMDVRLLLLGAGGNSTARSRAKGTRNP